MAQVIYCYGARPDSRDDRDLRKVYSGSQIPINSSVDLRRYVDHVYDQGSLSSCTSNALCTAYGMGLMKLSMTLNGEYLYFNTSRLFLYYNTRQYEGTTQHDAGASLRDTIKALKRQGVCKESDWPYAVKEYRTRPPSRCYESSSSNFLSHYERLDNQDVNQLRACIGENSPFVFSFNVYHSFHDYSNQKFGNMPMPTYYERSREPIGRHAVTAVGYDDSKKRVIALNSWGDGWGDRGYFYLPYDFITDSKMCYDFWKISFSCEREGGDNFSTVPYSCGNFVMLGNAADAYASSDCELQSSECEEYSSDCTDYATPYHQYNSACCCRLQ